MKHPTRFGSQRPRTTAARGATIRATATRGPLEPLIARAGKMWRVSQRWVVSVAEPRFAAAVREAVEDAGDLWRAIRLNILDPIDLTYYVLEGQVPRVPLKISGDDRFTFLDLQSEDPQAINYFGDAGTLDLYRRVHDKAADALRRLGRARTPRGVMLFPL